MEFDPRVLISDPCIECPSCGAPTFGVLSVDDHHLSRRCRLCLYPSAGEPRYTERLPGLRKKILYLDQFVWSNLVYQADPAVSADKHARTAQWKPVLAKLTSLVAVQALVCPQAGFHTDEMMPLLNQPVFVTALSKLQQQLSVACGYPDRHTIEIAQLCHAATAWADGVEPEGLAPIQFEGNPHVWSPKLIVGVHPDIYAGVAADVVADTARREQLLDHVVAGWTGDTTINASEQFANELAEYGPSLVRAARKAYADASTDIMSLTRLNLYTFKMIVRQVEDEAGNGHRRATDFLYSDAVQQVPFVRLRCALYAALARQAAGGRKNAAGLATDINIASTMLPYAGAIILDHKFTALATNPPVAAEMSRFPTTVIDGGCIADIEHWLDGVAERVSSAHLGVVGTVYGSGTIDRFRAAFPSAA